MFGGDVGGGRRDRIQHVVTSVKAAQARARQGHRLAHSHSLVDESGRAARQTHDVAHDRGIQRTRRHRRRVVAVVLLVVRCKAARNMFGSDIGHGRGNRIQHVVASISAVQAGACKRHDLAIAHILVSKCRGAARQTHDVTRDRTTQGTGQRRR